MGLLPAAWFEDEEKEDSLKDDEQDDEQDDESDGNEVAAADSVRSSIERSVASGAEEDWHHVPRGALRRRKLRSAQAKEKGGPGNSTRLVPWRRRDTDIGTRNVPADLDSSGDSPATSVNVAVSVDEDGGTKGRRGILPTFLRRKKATVHDLETGIVM
jgi:hypothetical protein